MSRNRATVCSARSSRSSGTRPLEATSAPRLRITRSRRTCVSAPSGVASVTSNWNDVLPRSSTAHRTRLLDPIPRRRDVPCADRSSHVALEDPRRALLPAVRAGEGPVGSRHEDEVLDDVAVRAEHGGTVDGGARRPAPRQDPRPREAPRAISTGSDSASASGATVWTQRSDGLDATRRMPSSPRCSIRRSACLWPFAVIGRSSSLPRQSRREPAFACRTTYSGVSSASAARSVSTSRG